jgi:hypothetical protein
MGHAWERLFVLQGPVGPAWRAPRMSFIRQQEDGTARQYSDCPWCLQTVIVIRDRALPSLRPLLQKYGEIVPVPCEEALYLFNATSIVDGLDEHRSTIARFDSGEVMAIERHVFKPEVLGNAEIFKLRSGHPASTCVRPWCSASGSWVLSAWRSTWSGRTRP